MLYILAHSEKTTCPPNPLFLVILGVQVGGKCTQYEIEYKGVLLSLRFIRGVVQTDM